MTYSRIDVEFGKRLAFLCESQRTGAPKNVVYLYERPDSSTFRYRAYNVCQALEASGVVRAHFFFKPELEGVRKHFRHVDAVVLARMRWSPEIENVILQLKALGKSVYFDVDDLVFDDRYISLIMNTLSCDLNDATMDYWFSYVGRIHRTASLCDGFLSTNAYLANKLQEKYEKDVWIVPNLLNAEQAEVSARLLERQRDRSTFRIGYFSGTPSHNNDFYSITHELREFLYKNRDARLVVVWYLGLPSELEPLVRDGRLTSEPLRSA